MVAFANSAASLVSVIALLLFVMCRVFSHRVSLDIIRLIAIVVTVFTGKGLLTSMRSRVFF